MYVDRSLSANRVTLSMHIPRWNPTPHWWYAVMSWHIVAVKLMKMSLIDRSVLWTTIWRHRIFELLISFVYELYIRVSDIIPDRVIKDTYISFHDPIDAIRCFTIPILPFTNTHMESHMSRISVHTSHLLSSWHNATLQVHVLHHVIVAGMRASPSHVFPMSPLFSLIPHQLTEKDEKLNPSTITRSNNFIFTAFRMVARCQPALFMICHNAVIDQLKCPSLARFHTESTYHVVVITIRPWKKHETNIELSTGFALPRLHQRAHQTWLVFHGKCASSQHCIIFPRETSGECEVCKPLEVGWKTSTKIQWNACQITLSQHCIHMTNLRTRNAQTK